MSHGHLFQTQVFTEVLKYFEFNELIQVCQCQKYWQSLLPIMIPHMSFRLNYNRTSSAHIPAINDWPHWGSLRQVSLHYWNSDDGRWIIPILKQAPQIQSLDLFTYINQSP